MKKQNLRKGIQGIISYIEETQRSHQATEPNAYGIKIMLQNLLENKSIFNSAKPKRQNRLKNIKEKEIKIIKDPIWSMIKYGYM